MKTLHPIAATLALLLFLAAPAFAGADWNDAGVKWMPYKEGIAEAKKKDKPVCLIVYTDWCPHCTNYSGVFHDPKVVEMSKNFVMIRLNGDQEKDLSKQFAVDGGYIPRTLFLSPDGKVDPAIHAQGRDKFMYFYDEKNPASVLAAMEEAKKKFD